MQHRRCIARSAGLHKSQLFRRLIAQQATRAKRPNKYTYVQSMQRIVANSGPGMTNSSSWSWRRYHKPDNGLLDSSCAGLSHFWRKVNCGNSCCHNCHNYHKRNQCGTAKVWPGCSGRDNYTIEI